MDKNGTTAKPLYAEEFEGEHLDLTHVYVAMKNDKPILVIVSEVAARNYKKLEDIKLYKVSLQF